MEKQKCKMLKPGDVVYPVRGVFVGKKCFVVDVKLGDQSIGMVWVEVKMDCTQTHMLFGSEDIDIKAPVVAQSADKKPAPMVQEKAPKPPENKNPVSFSDQPKTTPPKPKKRRRKRRQGRG